MGRLLVLFIACLISVAAIAQQGVQIPPMPRTGYVLDNARLLDAETIRQVNAISDGARRQAKAPIVVVTIPSLASVGVSDIEWYATTLFNAWAIGDRQTNRGVLLLVARDDRKARIEMGAGWGRAKDFECLNVMDGWILPHFKEGNYSSGIFHGVEALDSLVRTGEVPHAPLPKWVIPAVIAGLIVVLFVVIDLVRNGPNGWVGKLFASPIVDSSYSSGGYRRSYWDNDRNNSGGFFGGSSSSGGGFSGGGSSGGGGASGSW